MTSILLAPMINIVGQSLAVLAITLVAERFFRRHPMARHAILVCGLIGSLAIPGIALVEHRLGFFLVSFSIHSVNHPMTEPVPEHGPSSLQSESSLPEPVDRTPLDATSAAVVNQQQVATHAQVGALPATFGRIPDQETPTQRFNLLKPGWIGLVLLVWFAGFLISLARTTSACVALRSLRCRATVPSNPVLDSALVLVQQLWRGGLADVFVADGLRTPLSGGLWRPFVLLPEHALALTAGEIRDVLIHEFAHVQRRDFAVVCLQRVAAAFYWPNPLMHCLNRLLDAAREDICDNYVIEAGDAAAYSRTLLTLSMQSGSGGPTAVATCLFSCARTLEDRIRNLLDERRPVMTRLRSRLAIPIVGAFMTLLLCLAAVRTHTQAQDVRSDAKGLSRHGIVYDFDLSRQPSQEELRAFLDGPEPYREKSKEQIDGLPNLKDYTPRNPIDVIILNQLLGELRSDGTARTEGIVSAPVAYKDLMLILANDNGAAAVVFPESTESVVKYRYRYQSKDGQQTLSDVGSLPAQPTKEPLFIKAGPIHVGWAPEDRTRGWISYRAAMIKVQIAHAKDFEDRVEEHGNNKRDLKKLDLKQFIQHTSDMKAALQPDEEALLRKWLNGEKLSGMERLQLRGIVSARVSIPLSKEEIDVITKWLNADAQPDKPVVDKEGAETRLNGRWQFVGGKYIGVTPSDISANDVIKQVVIAGDSWIVIDGAGKDIKCIARFEGKTPEATVRLEGSRKDGSAYSGDFILGINGDVLTLGRHVETQPAAATSDHFNVVENFRRAKVAGFTFPTPKKAPASDR